MKRFLSLLLMMLAVACFGLVGCADIYANIKIQVSESEIVLSTAADSEIGPQTHVLEVDISGLSDANMVKKLYAEFQPTGVATVTDWQYSADGDKAWATISAQADGKTKLYIKGQESSIRISSDAIEVTVIQPVEQIVVNTNVFVGVPIGGNIDLKDTGILGFLPSQTSQTEVTYSISSVGTGNYFSNFEITGNVLTAKNTTTAKPGLIEIKAQSTEASGAGDANLIKTFQVMVYTPLEEDNIRFFADSGIREISDILLTLNASNNSLEFKVGVGEWDGAVFKNFQDNIVVRFKENDRTFKNAARVVKGKDAVNFVAEALESGSTSLTACIDIVDSNGNVYFTATRDLDIEVVSIVDTISVATDGVTKTFAKDDTDRTMVVGVFAQDKYAEGVLGTEFALGLGPSNADSPNFIMELIKVNDAASNLETLKNSIFFKTADGTRIQFNSVDGKLLTQTIRGGTPLFVSFSGETITDGFEIKFIANSQDSRLPEISINIQFAVSTSVDSITAPDNMVLAVGKSGVATFTTGATVVSNTQFGISVDDSSVAEFSETATALEFNILAKKQGSTIMTVTERGTRISAKFVIRVVAPMDTATARIVGAGVTKELTEDNTLSEAWIDRSTLAKREFTVYIDKNPTSATLDEVVVSAPGFTYSYNRSNSSVRMRAPSDTGEFNITFTLSFWKEQDGGVVTATQELSFKIHLFQPITGLSWESSKVTNQKAVSVYDGNSLAIDYQGLLNKIDLSAYVLPGSATYKNATINWSYLNSADEEYLPASSYTGSSISLLASLPYPKSIVGEGGYDGLSRTVTLIGQIVDVDGKIHEASCVITIVRANQITGLSVKDYDPALGLYLETGGSESGSNTSCKVETQVWGPNALNENLALSYVLFSGSGEDRFFYTDNDNAPLVMTKNAGIVSFKANPNWTQAFEDKYTVRILPSSMLNIQKEDDEDLWLKLFDNASVYYDVSIKIGDGSTARPYRIYTEGDLSDIENKGLDKHYVLMHDIVLTSEWTSIAGTFTGSFRSVEYQVGVITPYTIFGLTIDKEISKGYVGLFERLGTNAVIENLRIETGGITVSTDTVYGNLFVGILAGSSASLYIKNVGVYTAENAEIKVTVTGTNAGAALYAGGLVGENTGIITDSFGQVNLNIQSSIDAYVGGLVGSNSMSQEPDFNGEGEGNGYQILPRGTTGNKYVQIKSEIIYGMVTINGVNYTYDSTVSTAGKIYDTNGDEPDFNGSAEGNGYNIATETVESVDTKYVVIESANISDNRITLFGIEYHFYNEQLYFQNKLVGSADKSFVVSNIEVAGAGYVGGVAGFNSVNSVISDFEVSGNIIALSAIAGGAVGENQGSLSQILSSAKVSGGDYVGGIAGKNSGTIRFATVEFYGEPNGSATAGVSGANHVGGLVGSSTGGLIQYSFATSYIKNDQVFRSATPSADEFYGDILGDSNVGGLIGSAVDTNILSCFAKVKIGISGESPNHIGGLIGHFKTNGTDFGVTGAYAITDILIEATNYTGKYGGLIGYVEVGAGVNDPDLISTAYSVLGSGLGIQFANETSRNNFIGTTNSIGNITGTSYFAGTNGETTSFGAVRLTLEEMQGNAGDYADWRAIGHNEETWSGTWVPYDSSKAFNDGLPILKSEKAGEWLFNKEVTDLALTTEELIESDKSVLPTMFRFEDGRLVVVLDNLGADKTMNLSDLISVFTNLDSSADAIKLSITSSDSAIVSVRQNSAGWNDAKLIFKQSGTVEITIASRQNPNIKSIFQICVIGGFSDFIFNYNGAEIEDQSILQVYLNSTNNIATSLTRDIVYDDNIGVQYVIGDSGVAEFSDHAWDGYTANILVGDGSGHILNGLVKSIDPTSLSATLYASLTFFEEGYDTQGKRLTSVNLYNFANTKLDFFIKVFNGVTDAKLSSTSASMENQGSVEFSLTIFTDSAQEVADELANFCGLTISSDNLLSSEEIAGKTEEEITEMHAAKITALNLSPTITQIEVTDTGVIVYYLAQFAETRLEQDFVAHYDFTIKDEEGNLVKTLRLGIVWKPSNIQHLDVKHYLDLASYNSETSPSSSEIATGRSGVLKLTVTPEFADIDYLLITSSEALGDRISMEPKVLNNQKKLVSLSVPSEYTATGALKVKISDLGGTEPDFNGATEGNGYTLQGNQVTVSSGEHAGEYFISNNKVIVGGILYYYNPNTNKIFKFDGVVYLSTMLASGLAEGTKYTITVKGYKDNGMGYSISSTTSGEVTTVTVQVGTENYPVVSNIVNIGGAAYSYDSNTGKLIDFNGIEPDFNGADPLRGEGKLVLTTMFAPYVNMTVENPVGVTGNVVARGTVAEIKVTGVAKNSNISFAYTGTTGSDNTQQCVLFGDSNYTELGYQFQSGERETVGKSVYLYIGIDAIHSSSITMTATITSTSALGGTEVSTKTIELYIVDYIVKSLSLEGWSGNANSFAIQNGYIPLQIKLNTTLGNETDAYNLASEHVSGLDKSRFENSHTALLEKIAAREVALNAFGTTQSGSTAIWYFGLSTTGGMQLNTTTNFDNFAVDEVTDDKGQSYFKIKGKNVSSNLPFYATFASYYKLNNGVYEAQYKGSLNGTAEGSLKDSERELLLNFTISFENKANIESPDPITNAEQLRNMIAGGHYILMNDIDLDNWTPLATQIASLDGNGYVINLKGIKPALYDGTTQKTTVNAGLFDRIGTFTDDKGKLQATLLKNIIVDVSHLIFVDLSERHIQNVNFGFIAGVSDGGIIYNCEVVTQERHSTWIERYVHSSVASGINVESFAKSTFEQLQSETEKAISSNASVKPTIVSTFVVTSGTSTVVSGGIVGQNNGYISNSRVGRVTDSLGRALDRNTKTYDIVDSEVTIDGIRYTYGNDKLEPDFNGTATGNGYTVIGNTVQVGGVGYPISDSRVIIGGIEYTHSAGKLEPDFNGAAAGGGYTTSTINNITTITVQWAQGTISGINLFSTGTLGGIAGINSGVIGSSYFANGNLINSSSSTTGTVTGGLVGVNSGSISASYSEGITASIESDSLISDSALAPEDEGTSTTSNSDKVGRVTLGTIFSKGTVGGFVHTNNGTVENSYSNLIIASQSGVGGFVYDNARAASVIENCYSVSTVLPFNASNGAFTGLNKELNVNDSGTIENCYFLRDENFIVHADEPATELVLTKFATEARDSFIGFVFSEGNNELTWKNDESTGVAPRLVQAEKIATSFRDFDPTQSTSDIKTYSYSYSDETYIGKKTNPALIYNSASFDSWFGEQKKDSAGKIILGDYGNYARVIADIDLLGLSPTYSTSATFSGNLQGNGMTIKQFGLLSNAAGVEYIGLFAQLQNATVANLNIQITTVIGTQTYAVGALAGRIDNSNIENIKILAKDANSKVTAYNVAGGLAGVVSGTSSIYNVKSKVSVYTVYDIPAANNYVYYLKDASLQRNISYAGGVAGVLTTNAAYGDNMAKPPVVNNMVTGAIEINGHIVGGVFGLVDTNAVVARTRFIVLPSSEQKLNGLSIAGGLVGENRGVITLSYIGLDVLPQKIQDQALRDDLNAEIHQGRQDLFVGNSNVIGGLVGLNRASCDGYAESLNGLIEFSYSRVSVANANAKVAGGIVGLAVDNEFFIADNTVINLKNISTMAKTRTIELVTITDDNGTKQSFGGGEPDKTFYNSAAYLNNVYTTSSVTAKDIAGGLVGITFGPLNTAAVNDTGTAVAVLPHKITATTRGTVLGKALYTVTNHNDNKQLVLFSHRDSSFGLAGDVVVATVSGTEPQLVGNYAIDNIRDFEYNSTRGITLADVASKQAISKEVFGSFDEISGTWNFDWESGAELTNKIFPQIELGAITTTIEIKTEQEFLDNIVAGKGGRFLISNDLTFNFSDSNMRSKFPLAKSANLTISGQISGFAAEGAGKSKGDPIIITVENIPADDYAFNSFFGYVSSLMLNNIDFVFISAGNSEITANTTDTNFGILANQAQNSTFTSVSVSSGNMDGEESTVITFIPNNKKAAGVFVGQATSCTFERVSADGVNFTNSNYSIPGEGATNTLNAYFGGIFGLGVGNNSVKAISGLNWELDLNTGNSEKNYIAIGGVAGFNQTQATFDKKDEITSNLGNIKIKLTANNLSKIYIGGVLGFSEIGNCKIDGLNIASFNAEIITTASISTPEVYMGGLIGTAAVASIRGVNVTSSLKMEGKGSAIYAGGLVGKLTAEAMLGATTAQVISNSIASTDIVIDSKTANASVYAGGLVGDMRTIISGQGNQSALAPLYDQNFASGSITLSTVDGSNSVYAGGLFGNSPSTNESGTEVVYNTFTLRNSASDVDISVTGFETSYLGGISGYNSLYTDTCISYGLLSFVATTNSETVSMGGIAGRTANTIKDCLSAGLISNNGLLIGNMEAVIGEFNGATGTITSANVANTSYYCLDLTGATQKEGTVSTNVVSLDTLLNGGMRADLQWTGEGNWLPVVTALANITKESANTKLQKVATWDELKSAMADSTSPRKSVLLTADMTPTTGLGEDLTNIGRLLGNGHTITLPNGTNKSVFGNIPANTLVSGLVVSGTEIAVSSGIYGALALTNSGVIAKCAVGYLPKVDASYLGETNTLAGISNGVEDRTPASEWETLRITATLDTSSSATVGALVGINTGTINNTWSYADIIIDNSGTSSQACYFGGLVGENKADTAKNRTGVIEYVYTLGKLHIDNMGTNFYLGGVIGYDNGKAAQMLGMKDVTVGALNGKGGQVGGVSGNIGENTPGIVYTNDFNTGGFSANAFGTVKSFADLKSALFTNLGLDNLWTRTGGYNYGVPYLALGLNTVKEVQEVEGENTTIEVSVISTGTGTSKTDPYQIHNPVQLEDFVGSNAYFILTRNLEVFKSYGSGTISGNLSGGGRIITMKSSTLNGTTYALFNASLSGRLDYILLNVNFNFNTTSTGVSIAPLLTKNNGGTVMNCAAFGTITIDNNQSSTHVSGLVGELANGTISQCWSSVDITATMGTTGGLVGKMSGGEINQSFAEGTLKLTGATGYIGGLIGELSSTSIAVQDCYYFAKNPGTMSLIGGAGVKVGVFIGNVSASGTLTETQIGRNFGYSGGSTPLSTSFGACTATMAGQSGGKLRYAVVLSGNDNDYTRSATLNAVRTLPMGQAGVLEWQPEATGFWTKSPLETKVPYLTKTTPEDKRANL